MSLDLTDKSTLVQVMAWCHQATSHYLNQCWSSSMSPYCATRLPRLKAGVWVIKALSIHFSAMKSSSSGTVSIRFLKFHSYLTGDPIHCHLLNISDMFWKPVLKNSENWCNISNPNCHTKANRLISLSWWPKRDPAWQGHIYIHQIHIDLIKLIKISYIFVPHPLIAIAINTRIGNSSDITSCLASNE